MLVWECIIFFQCAPHNGSPLFAFKGVRTFFEHPRLASSWCSCCQQLGSCLCGGTRGSLGLPFDEFHGWSPKGLLASLVVAPTCGSNPHHVSGVAQGIWSILIHKARKIQKSSTKSETLSSFMLSNLYEDNQKTCEKNIIIQAGIRMMNWYLIFIPSQFLPPSPPSQFSGLWKPLHLLASHRPQREFDQGHLGKNVKR